MRHEEMLIGGTWTASRSGGVIEIENPATGEIVATAPKADRDDLDAAIAASVAGHRAWRAVDAWERSRRLRLAAQRIRDDRQAIAELLTEEQGKPLAQALAEVDTCVDQFEWYADEARRIYGRTVDGTTGDVRVEVRREPVGPVAAFTPWNFPIMLAARKIAPALAAGCSIVLKPAEEAPSACLRMVRAIESAGFPAGTINAVTGDPAEISERLVGSRAIRKISLTGSVRVGTLLLRLAADTIKNVSMELGGHAPVVVWSDVDVEKTARAAAAVKFRNAGQVCISPTRFLVHSDVVERFTEAFAAAARQVVVGDGREPGTGMGPLASARRLDEVDALIRDAVDRGARLVAGGERLDHLGAGHFYAPTVLTGVPEGASISTVEPFGPVALIEPVESLEEAIERANATDYGLAAYAFTHDLDVARQLSEGIEAGMVGVNSFGVSTPVAPFSGVKASGIGAENGTEAMDAYLVSKTVVTGIS